MDDYPAQIADFLEQTATKVRSLSVDRVANYATWAAVGIVVAMLGLVLTVFLLVGLFRILAEATTVELAYVILGGLFLIIGAFLWSKRTRKTVDTTQVREDANA
jgi:protein-S-isoprenylcysteine O-methyltransferase Ste14